MLYRKVRARYKAEEGTSGGYHSLPALLARCALWRHEVDDHVMLSSDEVAARTRAWRYATRAGESPHCAAPWRT